jgi:four helix bundle protein
VSKPFEELEVWQRAMALAAGVRRFTRFPALKDDPDFRSQMRRAAVSIPSNIAEGYERGTPRDSVKFYLIAKGSAGELRTQLLLAKSCGELEAKSADLLSEECRSISRMLMGYIQSIRLRSDWK